MDGKSLSCRHKLSLMTVLGDRAGVEWLIARKMVFLYAAPNTFFPVSLRRELLPVDFQQDYQTCDIFDDNVEQKLCAVCLCVCAPCICMYKVCVHMCVFLQCVCTMCMWCVCAVCVHTMCVHVCVCSVHVQCLCIHVCVCSVGMQCACVVCV